jgi:SAM-dependent methyltransferase
MRDLLRKIPGAMPCKFRDLRRRFGGRPFALLDIGAGNHSATRTREWFPACRYSGVDRDRQYHNDAADFAAMETFFELDLTTLAFERIPDGAFDAILMAHVVEHLHNGDEVVRALCPKLKPGGLFYLEFPAPRSVHFPSMRGTLNFYDDGGHVRVFSVGELAAVLRACGLEIVRAGTRRDPLRILLTPFRSILSLATRGFVEGCVFWDLLGFADVIVAEKPVR